MSWRTTAERTLIFLGVIFYLLVFPHGIHGDGYVRYEGLLNLLSTGKPLPIVYSYVGPLISSPLLLFGHIVKDSYWWICRFNTFIFLGTLWFFHRALRERFGADSARRLSLLLMAGGMFARHTTDYYSEVMSACFAALCIWLYVQNKMNRGALFGVLSVWNTPGTLFGFAFSQAAMLYRKRRFRILLFVALAAAGIFVENFWKYGEFYPKEYLSVHGYKNALPYSDLPGFSYPLWFGVLSVLFSFGKGLIFFTPGLLAFFAPWRWRGEKWDEFLNAGIFYLVGLIMVFSRWWAWGGDWFWGPRFYLFASILSAAGVHSLMEGDRKTPVRTAFTLALLTLSVWVSAQGIAFGTDNLEYCSVDGGYISFICQYVPEFSSLWRVFVAQDRGVNGKQLAFLIYHGLVYITLSTPLWHEFAAQVRPLAREAGARVFAWKEWRW